MELSDGLANHPILEVPISICLVPFFEETEISMSQKRATPSFWKVASFNNL